MMGKSIRVLWQYIQDLKIKNKLVLIFFFLMIVPLFGFTYLAYKQAAQVIEENTVYAAKQSFEQAASSLASKVNSASTISDYIILDEEATRVFGRNGASYEIPMQLKDSSYLLRLFQYLLRNEDIHLIRLFVPDEFIYAGDGQLIYSMESIRDDSWYEQLLNSNARVLLSPTTTHYTEKTGNVTEDKVLSVLRLVKNPNDYSKNMGVLSVDILLSDVLNIIDKAANITDTGMIYIENSRGQIIQSTASLEQINLWKVPNLATEQENMWQKTTVKGKGAIVGYKTIEGTDWRMVSIIPITDILSASSRQRNVLILIMIVMAAVAYVLAYVSSVSSTKRIYRLISKMRKVQNGELSVITQKFGRDEIGELAESYNFMIKKIEKLIDEQFKTGQEMKNAELKWAQAELKALQSQINPHFLYNTLDSINWMAIKHNCTDIESLISSLSNFYKLSLRKGQDIVKIDDEIQHVQTYVEIQNYRFDNSIKLVLNIKDILSYQIPKITLQPLVENSIMHGIQMKPDRSGTITISGKLEAGLILLCIEDNGIGMMEDALMSMFQQQSKDDWRGFGVHNINERLKLYFGAEYGLSYTSVSGIGTKVEIRIPPVIG
ncbi:cache domain-containing sensor histidine kinase [Paenibacillus oryzisoli]|uniref:histidine kinase n=1 Tax=Paenibacillus oryzisoli TaxID=1850517 RepID=A0A198AC23_9BACL|nr:sensor histidine kinase [Paenibacillus oryzisoli]OAS19049.1 hypothetical protein A8708_27370 [Paenibacillus oryzisoli]